MWKSGHPPARSRTDARRSGHDLEEAEGVGGEPGDPAVLPGGDHLVHPAAHRHVSGAAGRARGPDAQVGRAGRFAACPDALAGWTGRFAAGSDALCKRTSTLVTGRGALARWSGGFLTRPAPLSHRAAGFDAGTLALAGWAGGLVARPDALSGRAGAFVGRRGEAAARSKRFRASRWCPRDEDAVGPASWRRSCLEPGPLRTPPHGRSGQTAC